jgi:hypothetical protein
MINGKSSIFLERALDLKMTKLMVQLNGGLGNQMFQYAHARSLALRQGLELVLDDWSGFVRDLQYRRHYELGALPIQARLANPWERLPLWLYRWQHRTGQPSAALVESHWYGQFITEVERVYLPQLQKLSIDRTTWITGYWQSPCYFDDYAAQIRTELMPSPAQQPRFQALAEQIRGSESVALGVRLYEESKDPAAHAREGRVKTVVEIRQAVARVRSHHPDARFFVFCTHRSPLLAELELPSNTIFVTHDDGYEGTLESLWLLTQCRHHIFTNSSYYWWGAWLSAAVRAREEQVILAADNFKNIDGLCPEWERF